MRNLLYTYLKPQHYYRSLFIFFLVLALILATLLMLLEESFSVESLFLTTIIILFLFLFLGVVAEYFRRSEYLGPLVTYELEQFFNKFRRELQDHTFVYSNYFNTYDVKTKAKFEEVFLQDKVYSLSSILKKENTYHLGLVDRRATIFFDLLTFFGVKRSTCILKVRRIKDELKIVHIE